MIIKVRQLLLRAGIVFAFVILFAALLFFRSSKPPENQILLETAAEREAWLTLRGWQVGEPAVSEVIMPEIWQSANGQRWLAIQQEQGLSPDYYAGASVTRCLYPVKNGIAPEMYAEIYLCGNVLCGACIYDAETQIMRPVG